jgi:glutamine synthetase
MQEQAVLLHEMRAACELMKLPLEGLVKELAPAQYELNLEHVDDPMLAADHAQMLNRPSRACAKASSHRQLYGQAVW